MGGAEAVSAHRTTIKHISMVWAAQITAMGLQLVYAGVTSRLISPDGFGAFAVALTVTALGGMFASAGLANAAARRTENDVAGDRAIVTAAVGSGLIVGGAFMLTAPSWARLWGDPNATALIRILSVGLVSASYANALGGVARRLRRMGVWAMSSLVSSLLGMLMGGAIACWTREPWSLTVMPVASSLLLSLILLVALRKRGLPTRYVAQAGQDVIFGAKSLGASLMTYTAYSIPAWTLSRWLGASVLGSWNRAVVVGQVPLENAVRAVQTVIFPKFRWDTGGGESVRRRWSYLLATVALTVLPLAALTIPAIPIVTRLLLGARWTEAGEMAQFVLAATALSALSSILATALEASNRFRILWIGQSVTLAAMAVTSVGLLATGDWRVLGVGYVAGAAINHAAQLVGAITSQLLDPSVMRRWYGLSAVLCLALGLVGSGLTGLFASPAILLGSLLCLGAGYLATLYALRTRLIPLQVLLRDSS